MVIYMQTWVYGGDDRCLVGSLTPNLYTQHDIALSTAKECIESLQTSGYVYDDVNSTLHIYDYDEDNFEDDEEVIGTWSKRKQQMDDDDLWRLTPGATDYTNMCAVYAQNVD